MRRERRKRVVWKTIVIISTVSTVVHRRTDSYSCHVDGLGKYAVLAVDLLNFNLLVRLFCLDDVKESLSQSVLFVLFYR